MGKWYECKIKYRKLLEDDQEKVVNETYLVDALSFTEAEKRITEEMVQYISGEFSITNSIIWGNNGSSILFDDPDDVKINFNIEL